MKVEAAKHTAADVEVALRSHFDAPRYALVTGVRDEGGWDACRTCDALVMGTWQSVGRHLHGVEIKVARSDWLKEIQDLTKAEAFSAHCDFWWIAATPGIAKLEELPATWGLLEMVGKGMRVRRPATRNEKPEPISRGMLASLCRRVVEQAPAEAVLKAAVVKARREERSEMRTAKAASEAADYDLDEALKAKKLLNEFREATGVHLGDWNLKENAARFKRFVASERAVESSLTDLKRARDIVGEAQVELNAAVKKALDLVP